MQLKQRLSFLLAQLSHNMHEREHILAIALLGAITGQNTFLFGPPGTAKSLISRRLSQAFNENEYFECLMNRFTTPEEIFGPISISALKKDLYIRQINGYLPTAHFAFLDEIWKSSPAILNNLLTIINEHFFKNGNERINVPLRSLVVASNEVPMENQGLDALYDRFILRVLVPPIQNQANFENLINNKPSLDKIEIDESIKLSLSELDFLRSELHNVQLSSSTQLMIRYIYKKLQESFNELKVYVSDRRWQRAAMILKGSALCNDRLETNASDVVLLKYCLWTHPENRELLEKIIYDAIKTCYSFQDIDLSSIDKIKENIENNINNELFYTDDIYEVVKLLDGEEYFKVNVCFQSRYYSTSQIKETVYIPYKNIKTSLKYYPVDDKLNDIKRMSYNFNSSTNAVFSYENTSYNDFIFEPNILCKKGDRKDSIAQGLVDAFLSNINQLKNDLLMTLSALEQKREEYKKELSNIFISDNDLNKIITSFLFQISQIKLRLKDCERLESLCQNKN